MSGHVSFYHVTDELMRKVVKRLPKQLQIF